MAAQTITKAGHCFLPTTRIPSSTFLDQTRSFWVLKWRSISNFFSSLKTRFDSVPSWMRKRRILHLWSRLSTTWAKSWCFLSCLNGDIFRSFRWTVDMVHTTHLTLLPDSGWISWGSSYNLFSSGFYQFGDSSSYETTLPWPILNISSLLITF